MTDTREVQTRWGIVKHTSERLDRTYTRHTYEGPRQAVIVTVGERSKSTTQQYEHMFTIESISSQRDGWFLTIVCMASNYAGD